MFSILIHGLVLVLYFLCQCYILFYHANWLQVFKLLNFHFFQVKAVNHTEGHVICQDIKHQLQKNIFHEIFFI